MEAEDGGNVETEIDDDDGDAVQPEAANKDKMIATVVVDMRIHSPNLQQGVLELERMSETDLSMTDTEGNGTIITDLSTDPANNDIARLEDVPEVHIDPLAPPNIVRRRNIHEIH